MERQVPIRELNQRTSAVVREVLGGAAVTITSGVRREPATADLNDEHLRQSRAALPRTSLAGCMIGWWIPPEMVPRPATWPRPA